MNPFAFRELALASHGATAKHMGTAAFRTRLLATAATIAVVVAMTSSGASAQYLPSVGGTGGGTGGGAGGGFNQQGADATQADAGGGGGGSGSGLTNGGGAGSGGGGDGGVGGTTGFDDDVSLFGAGNYFGGSGDGGNPGFISENALTEINLGGGGGGSGGYGAYVTGTTNGTAAFGATANVTGGQGGFGGDAIYTPTVPSNLTGNFGYGTYQGGNGGDGGVGVAFSTGEQFTVGTDAQPVTIQGGAAGNGGIAIYDSGYGYGSAAAGVGGNGGNGGAGIVMLAPSDSGLALSSVTIAAGSAAIGGYGGYGGGAEAYQSGYGNGYGGRATGGNGGRGGDGIVVLNAGTITNFGIVQGGQGGSGDTGFFGDTIVDGISGPGGSGINVVGSATIENSGSVLGGKGGNDFLQSGNATVGADGGAGIAGTNIVLDNNGAASLVRGGDGGDVLPGGTPGLGGAGIAATNSTIRNLGGSIVGGNGGGFGYGFVYSQSQSRTTLLAPGVQALVVAGDPDPAGGVAIIGSDLTVINAGTIVSGVSTNGVQQPVAIQFTGGINSLTIYAQSNIEGFSIAASAADTFALGGPTDATFAVERLGAIGSGTDFQGFGQFGKVDESTWTLTGTNTGVTGPWSVTGGTLVVDANVPGLDFTVFDPTIDPILGGSGTVGNLTAGVNGVVAPGIAVPYTTLHATQNVVFNAGSTFQVQINAAGQTDLILAQGTATINGAAGGAAGPTVNVLAANGVYNVNQRFTILTAAGGRTGTFSSLTTTTNLAFLNPYLTYDPNDVILAFRQNGVGFPSVGNTMNQRDTATGIQALGAGNPIYDTVLGQSADGARAAFDAASGEIHASALAAAFEDSRLPRESILNRLDDVGGGPGALGAVGSFGGLAPSLPAAAQGYAPVHKGYDMPVLAAAPAPLPPYTVWATGFGDFGSIDGNGNAAKLDRTLGGFVAGVDARVDGAYFNNWRIGVAGGYTSDDLTVRQRQSSGTFETYFGGLYAGAHYGAVDIKLGALGGGTSTDTRRTIAFPGFLDTARSSYSGTMAQGFGEIGYKFGLAHGYVEPLFQGAAIHYDQDGFRESGGPAALLGFSQSYDIQITTLGVKAESQPFGGLPIVARAFLGWRHAFGDVTPTALLAFESGSPAFLIGGVPIDRDAVLAQVNLDYRATGNLTFGVGYSAQAGERAYDNAVKGRMEYKF